MAENHLRIALAQVDTTVGDFPGNVERIVTAWKLSSAAGAAITLFPELTLTGYPPEDLLLKPSFLDDSQRFLERLAGRITKGIVLVGFANGSPSGPHNAAALIAGGRVRDVYHKCTLPNYGVFDEKRYFRPGRRCPVYAIGPWRIAVNICEDLWARDGVPAMQARAGAANLMLNLSASPYHARKGRSRERLVVMRARRLGLPVLQTNLVGGQDELLFDGQSLAADASGRLIARARAFTEQVLLVDIDRAAARDAAESHSAADQPQGERGRDEHGRDEPEEEASSILGPSDPPPADELVLDVVEHPDLASELAVEPRSLAPSTPAPASGFVATGGAILLSSQTIHPELGEEEEVYRALCLGLADYARKNGFEGVVLGLSGGIDSALTAVIAADALGPQAVVALSMPSQFSSRETRDDARETASRLGIRFHEIPIDEIFRDAKSALATVFRGLAADITEENLQARIRGMLLMAFSNKYGHLVLATGNKSEVAVGYCTLYGDMVGGFSVLKDVLKTQVYRLARWRNAQARAGDLPPIPEATIDRAPSAELKPEQKDTDSLPPYEVLDPLVVAFVEEDASPRDLRAAGHAADLVDRVFAMIQGNEYKRRQAAPGIKITPRAFGRDRRYPLTNRYRPGPS
ncbi:MAG: NAD(+) synthase [Candidatus Eisenbacteria bacterium]|nr:NAD(+) synthase [Candidatus Eisenbacteria bacterium]